MAVLLYDFPETLTPSGWINIRTSQDDGHIVDEYENDYEFSCLSVLRKTPTYLILYGKLNALTALQTWGHERYVILIVSDNEAVMSDIADNRKNYD